VNVPGKSAISKEEIIAAIRECVGRMGRAPFFKELQSAMKPAQLSRKRLLRHFPSYTAAMREAGNDERLTGPIGVAGLLEDWAEVARAVSGLPSQTEYDTRGQFCVRTYYTTFKKWSRIPGEFVAYVKSNKLEEKWPDVLALAEAVTGKGMTRGRRQAAVYSRRQARRKEHGILYGAPATRYGMAHEPVNEAGVLFLFGLLSPRLRLVVTHVQTAFPDCEVMQEVSPGLWRRKLAEVEMRSRNFLLHKHDPKGCHMIVCWEHNWPECPLEVIELSKLIG
jgi:hypothetical protein